MQVGIDTYVTVAEAGEYIASHYRSTDPARIRWEALSEDDKAVLLLQACTEIEMLPLQGRKSGTNQVLAFPRHPYQEGFETEPPTNVIVAQIELALWLSDDNKAAEISKRAELQRQGVSSFSVGDLSENYKSGVGNVPAPLACPKAAALLSVYLNGGYATC